MTDGTSQGLFIVVAIVIFGIFVVLADTLFGNTLMPAVEGLFVEATEQARENLTGEIIDKYEDTIFDYAFNETDKTVALNGFKPENGVTDVEIPTTLIKDGEEYRVTSIGPLAFREKGLTSVKISESIEIIGMSAFSRNKLSKVTIPDSVTSLGEDSFSHNELISLKLSKSITEIPRLAFQFNKLTDLEVPKNVTSIGASAFYNNVFTNIDIPNSVTSIGRESFLMCMSLKEVELPEGIFLGSDAFEYQVNITYRK